MGNTVEMAGGDINMAPQAGFDPPIARTEYHTEWDILTIQATTAAI